MSYSTIYDQGGNVITDGVQSQRACDATLNTARSIAATRRRAVVVEDRGTRECYRVGPSGRCYAAPRGWVPVWDSTE